MERWGALNLVRQLASDLAERDAQMTVLRRKAEERERVLRKMLTECEVSNLDIETRLRERDQVQERQNGRLEERSRIRRPKGDIDLVGTQPDDDLDKRIARALEDEHDDYQSVLRAQEDQEPAASYAVSDIGNDSASETLSQTTEGAKNWKTYFWSGNTVNKKTSKAPSIASSMGEDVRRTRSRASSGAQQPLRKGLSNDLFMPPTPGTSKSAAGAGIASLRRLHNDERSSSVASRRSSSSVANWALRLVAGNNQAKSDPDKQSIHRGRTLSTGVENTDTMRDASSDSVKSSNSTPRPNGTARGRPARSSLGPTGTIKNVSPESLRNPISKFSVAGPLSPPIRRLSNAGPVEMDTILPDDTRPPALTQLNYVPANQEFLTDRFGFIYDQRRRKRQSEATAALQKQKRASNVESLGDHRDAIPQFNETEQQVPSPDTQSLRPPSTHSSLEEPSSSPPQPGKRWQDFLKIATFPTELLSHTPSVAPITTVETVEAEMPLRSPGVSVDKRGSVPSLSANPEPLPSIVSGNAEFVSPSVSGPTTPTGPIHKQPDPVKALLEQLTDLHDNLQRDKTIKWNEFLRKVRAERKREGDAAAADPRSKNIMPENLVTDGEIIGIASLGNKGNVGRAKWKEFKQLVLGGIPVSYRSKIWLECSGAGSLRAPGYYEDLITNGEDDPIILSQIEMDITRTLTDNIFFRKGPGISKLKEVLVAYSRRNKEVGYCQGMNLITACLLLIMPTAEDAFWVLASMIENILPQNYYDHSLLTSRADQVVLRQYVTELLPKLSAHLDELGIELEALSFQWFLSVFTDCLSAEALFRVWDVVLCMHDGSTFLFQVALALLKLNERALLECDNSAGVYHYINHQMTNHAISIDGLIQASEALRKVVKRKEVEERRAVAVEREIEVMKQREELRRERLRNAKERREAARNGNKDTNSDPAAAPDVEPALPEASNRPIEGVAISPSLPALSRTSSVAPSSHLSRDEDEIEEDRPGFAGHTPMPIDEEAMWRA